MEEDNLFIWATTTLSLLRIVNGLYRFDINLSKSPSHRIRFHIQILTYSLNSCCLFSRFCFHRPRHYVHLPPRKFFRIPSFFFFFENFFESHLEITNVLFWRWKLSSKLPRSVKFTAEKLVDPAFFWLCYSTQARTPK